MPVKKRGPRIMVIVLITAALLAAFILTALPGTTRSRVGDWFGSVLDPVAGFFSKGVTSVGDYFGAVRENRKLHEQIRELEAEKAALNLEIMQNKDKVDAYEELKAALSLLTTFEDKHILGAAVINRELGPLFDLFRVKAGRLDGVTVSSGETLPAVDQNIGLVGRVHSTELSSSKILPLIHEAFAVSAKVEGTYRASFRVRGDLELKEEGLCLADLIAEGTPVRVGDRLVTSGESGVYPEGILIGHVTEIRRDSQGRTLTCVVEPAVSFDDLRYVFILMEADDES